MGCEEGLGAVWSRSLLARVVHGWAERVLEQCERLPACWLAGWLVGWLHGECRDVCHGGGTQQAKEGAQEVQAELFLLAVLFFSLSCRLVLSENCTGSREQKKAHTHGRSRGRFKEHAFLAGCVGVACLLRWR